MPTIPPSLERQTKRRLPDMGRKERAKVYNSSRWHKLRILVLSEQPLCPHCQREPSHHVDHIRDLATHPHLAFDRGNLQGLCEVCHTRKTVGLPPLVTPIATP